MELIQTKSFRLASISRGDKDAKEMALLLPGRLDTKDYATFPSHAEYLAKHGFLAVAIDPPGTWESPGGIELFTTTNYLKAVNELIDYFGNKPTLLIGHSRGAAVAILASNNPAVIGIVPVMANYGEPTAPRAEVKKKGYQLSLRDLPPGISKTKDQKEFKLSIDYWTDGAQYHPDEALKQCTKPKLLIYGTDDSFTPVKVVKELYSLIPEPKMIKEIKCAHDYRYSAEAIAEVEREIGKFLETYKI